MGACDHSLGTLSHRLATWSLCISSTRASNNNPFGLKIDIQVFQNLLYVSLSRLALASPTTGLELLHAS